MTYQHIQRLFEEPKKSYFLFGPRGTGKSTLTRWRHPKALILDLRLPELKLKLASDPQYLLELVHAQPKGQVVIIDEIQKVPELLSLVHIPIEEKQCWIFILTGSSSRKLKREGVDLLAGRALKKNLHPFMAIELGELFNLEKALKYGLLPPTVASWISILEDLLIAFQLQVFTKRAKRELSVHPKFYYFDAGVFRTIRPQSIEDPTTELEGPALEGLVAQHLLAWCDYTFGENTQGDCMKKDLKKFFIGEKFKAPDADNPSLGLAKQGNAEIFPMKNLCKSFFVQSPCENTLTFWRTRSGVEVDFVLHGPLGFWAIEVKNTRQISADDLRHLKIFLEDYPEAKAIFLYRGTDRLMKGNILCMPCSEFLSNLKPNQKLL